LGIVVPELFFFDTFLQADECYIPATSACIIGLWGLHQTTDSSPPGAAMDQSGNYPLHDRDLHVSVSPRLPPPRTFGWTPIFQFLANHLPLPVPAGTPQMVFVPAQVPAAVPVG
jgi:hypothetical protein